MTVVDSIVDVWGRAEGVVKLDVSTRFFSSGVGRAQAKKWLIIRMTNVYTSCSLIDVAADLFQNTTA